MTDRRAVLAGGAAAALLAAILYVDLCNEWPAGLWAPFVQPPQGWGDWPTAVAQGWIGPALDAVRAACPGLPLCFSSDRLDAQAYLTNDVSRLDLIEQHIWMSKQDGEAFNNAVSAAAAAVPTGEWYDRLAAFGGPTYRARPDHWTALLTARIAEFAAVSRRRGKPLATTECWATVNAVDWPGMDWGWIKDCCAVGVGAAAASGRWLAIATSNFCGPQSVAKWHDVAWHRRQTARIKGAAVAPDLRTTKLYERL